MTFVSDHEAAAIPQPGKCSLNFPSSPVPPQRPSILHGRTLSRASMRTDNFRPSLPKLNPQPVSVVPFIQNQTANPLSGPPSSFSGNGNPLQGRSAKVHFRFGSRRNEVCHRNTFAVDQNHPLCAFPFLGFSDTIPPFLAGAKLPSMKHSDHLSWPFSSSSARKALQAFSQTPVSSHSFSLRQQVLWLGKESGNASQGLPVQRIHRRASKTARSSFHFRPPLGEGGRFGKKGCSFFHCASVTCHLAFGIGRTSWIPKVQNRRIICDHRILIKINNLPIRICSPQTEVMKWPLVLVGGLVV